jgi:hypothetical protein
MQRMQQTQGNRALQRFLQRSAAGSGAATEEVPLADRIQSRAGGGSSLDGGVQRQLESGIGADMSGVRVHTDNEADNMAKSVDAVAFTTGNDIFFRSGTYNPGSEQGMRLLAHEATHTVQQSQGPVSGTPSAGGVSISDPSDSYEQAAEASAARVVSGQNAAPAQRMASSAPSVQRAEDEEEVQTMRSSTYNSTPVQRAADEEEEVQTMRTSTYASMPSVQRAADEEEEVQTMRTSTYNSTPVQRAADEEEEEVQAMRPSTYNSTPVQRQGEEEEEMQTMRASTYSSMPSVQRAADEEEEVQTMRTSTYNSTPVQRAAEDEEEVQTMRASTYNSTPVQREPSQDEEEMQTMRTSTYSSMPSVQRAEDEEEVQTMRASTYNTPVQRHVSEEDQG